MKLEHFEEKNVENRLTFCQKIFSDFQKKQTNMFSDFKDVFLQHFWKNVVVLNMKWYLVPTE